MTCVGGCSVTAVGVSGASITPVQQQQAEWIMTPLMKQLLLVKMAAKFHRFPLLSIQTIATLYHQKRSEDINNCYLINNRSAIDVLVGFAKYLPR